MPSGNLDERLASAQQVYDGRQQRLEPGQQVSAGGVTAAQPDNRWSSVRRPGADDHDDSARAQESFFGEPSSKTRSGQDARGSSTVGRHGEPVRAPLARMPLEPGSRAETKGGDAPTGMSATAAVAGKRRYTPPAYARAVG